MGQISMKIISLPGSLLSANQQYAEKVVIKLKGKRDVFEDRFIIRYWEPDLILSKFEECGMTVDVDLSYMFAASGAQYFVLTKG